MAKQPAKSAPKESTKPEGKPAGGLSASTRTLILKGPEPFLRLHHTARLRELLTKEHGQVDVHTFDGQSANPADVLDECRSMGLIASYKLIVVENAEALVKEDSRPLFERYCQNPAEGATLVLRSGAWKAGKLDGMVDAMIECEAPSEAECVVWVVARVKAEHKATIAPDAAKALVERVGAELGMLDTELAKLSAASAGEAITLELVTQLVGVSRDEEAWGIQKLVLAGDAQETVSHLRHMLGVSREPSQLVMYSINDLARKVHTITCATAQKQNVQALTGPLKMWGPSQYAILDAGKKLTPRATMAFLRACVKADHRSKTGLGDVEQGLEVLTLRASQLFRKR